MRRNYLRVLAGAVMLAFASMVAMVKPGMAAQSAEADYPVKPIRIVTTEAGSGTDSSAQDR